jgi:hypothetical protein
MPLRDHFRPPLNNKHSWEGFHGQWPAMIVMALSRKLPSRYAAEPRVHLGSSYEIDVCAFDVDDSATFGSAASTEQGGVATATWAPPKPTLEVVSDLPDQDEYAVLVFDNRGQRRLVAAVEIVSPANKDRPENRRAFVSKCAALLQQGVSVALIDLVTTRRFNLYGELLELIGQRDPALIAESPSLYAAACRWSHRDDIRRFEAWAYPLDLGKSLPTLPLWLAEDLAVPLELDASYEETCRVLRLV